MYIWLEELFRKLLTSTAIACSLAFGIRSRDVRPDDGGTRCEEGQARDKEAAESTGDAVKDAGKATGKAAKKAGKTTAHVAEDAAKQPARTRRRRTKSRKR